MNACISFLARNHDPDPRLRTSWNASISLLVWNHDPDPRTRASWNASISLLVWNHDPDPRTRASWNASISFLARNHDPDPRTRASWNSKVTDFLERQHQFSGQEPRSRSEVTDFLERQHQSSGQEPLSRSEVTDFLERQHQSSGARNHDPDPRHIFSGWPWVSTHGRVTGTRQEATCFLLHTGSPKKYHQIAAQNSQPHSPSRSSGTVEVPVIASLFSFHHPGRDRGQVSQTNDDAGNRNTARQSHSVIPSSHAHVSEHTCASFENAPLLKSHSAARSATSYPSCQGNRRNHRYQTPQLTKAENALADPLNKQSGLQKVNKFIEEFVRVFSVTRTQGWNTLTITPL